MILLCDCVYHVTPFYTASVILNIVPLTDAPKDVETLNCSIQSDSDNLYMIWTITHPGYAPVEIVYSASSALNMSEILGQGVSAVLTRYGNGVHIESSVNISLTARNATVNCRTAAASVEETFCKWGHPIVVK